MFVCKRPAGSGLQVLFECGRAVIVIKTDRRHHTPWRVLGSVGGIAMIVSGQSQLKVAGKTDIALIGVREALQEVNVFHESYWMDGPSFVLLGSLQPSLKLRLTMPEACFQQKLIFT